MLNDYYGNDKEAFVEEFSTNKTAQLPVVEFIEKKNPMCHFSQRKMHYTDLPSLIAVLKIEHLSESNQKKLAVFLKEHSDVFSKHPLDVGRYSREYIKFDIQCNRNCNLKYRPISAHLKNACFLS